MKKIGLFLGTDPDKGGMFQYSQTVLNALMAFPHRSYKPVVAYVPPSWGKHLSAYDIPACFIRNGQWGMLLGKLWTSCGLSTSLWRRLSVGIDPVSRAIWREKCDLWIFPAQDNLTYQSPVVALGTIHDLMHRYESRFPEVSAYGRFRAREHRFRNICRWAAGILVDSDVGKQQVLESYGASPHKVFVLPYVAPRRIYNSLASPDIDKRFQLPPKFFFYPAKFWMHKNHQGLIRAMAVVKKEYADLSLVLVGSRKNEYQAVLDLVKELRLEDNVRFYGYVTDADISEFYRRARALIMPTFFGPTNIPPLEAFVIGCPVAISKIYGIPEQVGDAALLFDPHRVSEIADTMRRLWVDDELCKELADRGKKRDAAWSQQQFNQALQGIVSSLVRCDMEC
jgi:glycosyltransferase involved in cell wall biosynthesis